MNAGLTFNKDTSHVMRASVVCAGSNAYATVVGEDRAVVVLG